MWKLFVCYVDGYVKVDDILQDRKFTKVCGNLTTDEIIHIVNTNDKQRFQLKFSSSLYIAASQGHTIEVSNYMPLCNPACNTNVLLRAMERWLAKLLGF